MAFTVDGQGFLVGEDGKRITDADGKPVQVSDVKGVVTQSVMDQAIESRLKRQKEQDDQVRRELIEKKEKELLTASNEEREKLNAQIKDLEGQVSNSEQLARERAERASADTTKKLAAAVESNAQLQTKLRRTLVENELSRVAVHKDHVFRDPSDLIANLNPFLHFKDVVDAAGNKTGDETFVFKMQVPKKDSEGKRTEEMEERELGALEAAQVVAAAKPYLIQGTKTAGTGTQNVDAGAGGGSDDDAVSDGTVLYDD